MTAITILRDLYNESYAGKICNYTHRPVIGRRIRMRKTARHDSPMVSRKSRLKR
jgi:hypothetical protein